MTKTLVLIPQESIESKILLVRGRKVIMDRDLAVLYDVPTKALKQAVKRNLERFPSDFMFELSDSEFKKWRSQIVTSITKQGAAFSCDCPNYR